MKLLFLCGSLAPGRDGVGDYTRRLAGACTALGAECALLALNDPYVTTREESDNTLRLPAREDWTARLAAARAFTDRAVPDWLSLQFVPYAFAPRGLVWKLGARLRALGKGRRWHAMFHEVWIGAEEGASGRDRLVGAAQRHAILQLVRSLAPRAVTTTNHAYASLLGRHGISALPLPLFGNIPAAQATEDDRQWLQHELRGEAPDRWVFAFFGTLHPQWQPEPLFTHLRAAAAGSSRRVVLASIGRLGPGAALWDHLDRQYGAEFDFVRLGEQSEGRIAALLSRADFGVAASPWALIGKSGTAQCMAEHGLPVLVSRDDVRYPGVASAPASRREFIKVEADLPERLPALRRGPAVSAVEEIAARFLAHLGES